VPAISSMQALTNLQ